MDIVGHRGARGEAPENTLTGFDYLRSLNIHRVELDLRLSADGELIVLHDATTNRTCNEKGQADKLSADSLAKLDATKKAFPTWHERSGVPRLEEVLSVWPEIKHIQLEIKTTDMASLHRIAVALRDTIGQFNLQENAVVTSSDTRALSILQQTAPSIQRGLVAGRFLKNPLQECKHLRCKYLVINHHRCNPNLIQQAHMANLFVSVWTVNRVVEAKKFELWGADSLITDFPKLMQQHLQFVNM